MDQDKIPARSITPVPLDASTKRFHPYKSTPSTRRLHVPKPLSKSPVTTGRLRKHLASSSAAHSSKKDDLQGLVNKTWQVFYLSPLYGFSTHPQSLKRYGRSLVMALTLDKSNGVVGDNGEGSWNNCIFSIYQGLKINENDPEAIQILVTGKPPNEKSGSPVRLIALLCGLGLEQNPCGELEKHFAYYPILLVKATSALTTTLSTWLKRHFDCCLSPLLPTSLDLAWVAAMWSGCLGEKKNKPVELLYRVPAECKGIASITYTIDANDCKAVWDSIRTSDSEELSGEEVRAFFKSLEEHFYECFRVKLWKMELSRVGTSLAYIGEGKVKIFSAPNARQVLRFLSDIALERFQSLSGWVS